MKSQTFYILVEKKRKVFYFEMLTGTEDESESMLPEIQKQLRRMSKADITLKHINI